MAAFDANESLTPFREGLGYGAILFDRTHLRQAGVDTRCPMVRSAALGQPRPAGVLGRARRGVVRRRALRRRGPAPLPARRPGRAHQPRPPPVARQRPRAQLRRIPPAARHCASASCRCPRRSPRITCARATAIARRSCSNASNTCIRSATAPARPGDTAPWEAAGRLIARFHRAGLDHADLNAHNLLFDDAGNGWMIDLDRSVAAHPGHQAGANATSRASSARCSSCAASAAPTHVERDFKRLRDAYEAQWNKGY